MHILEIIFEKTLRQQSGIVEKIQRFQNIITALIKMTI